MLRESIFYLDEIYHLLFKFHLLNFFDENLFNEKNLKIISIYKLISAVNYKYRIQMI
jgi:hypothetical protein